MLHELLLTDQLSGDYMISGKSKMGNRLSKADKTLAVEMYKDGYLLKDIAVKIQTSINTISRHLKNIGMRERDNSQNPHRKYHTKHFIDKTPEYWYLVGIMLTDGHINNNAATVVSKDFSLLKKIDSVFFKSENNVMVVNKVEDVTYYRITFYSVWVTDILRKDIIFQKKSYDVKFPTTTTNQNFWSLMRGIIDGDGCIYGDKSVQICSASINFINGCAEELLNRGFIINHYHSGAKSGNTRQIHIMGGKSARKKFLMQLYSDKSHLRLERKYNTFVDNY